ncbi:putative membrane protein [Sinorhizobium kostiense]|uniref:Membrane protein n=1 Tax=Sinorhizobium kostiense TaxID=76747 RepID=A0ABS4QW58_9HYPH|nr:NnrU family protein [Sinorhizobium kostiense]MBP2234867.1 putative membrane protein [Sinorhizobium kostiense]
MPWLVIGVIVFLGVHSIRIVAPGFRDRTIAARGERAWKAIYSLASIAGFVLVIWGYGQARQTAPVVYTGTPALAGVAMLLMIPASILLVAALLPAGRIKVAVKHPTLTAVKTWAVAHLLVNGDLASIVLFGGFLLWAVADRISESRRLEAGLAKNPVLVSGRSDVIAVIVGLVIYGLFVWKLHEWLFGVAPIIE